MFELPELEFPSTEEMAAQRYARTTAPLEAARKANPVTYIFNAVSLVEWTSIAAAAGIDHISSEVACSMPMDVILNFEEPRAGDDIHWEQMRLARASLKAGEMMRWDCCSSLDMKSVMSDGGAASCPGFMTDPENPAVPSWKTITDVGDPRFFDIALEYPGSEIALVKRPWVEARREGSHPVEYRVFVKNGEIEGVANYYIQRDLELTSLTQSEVGSCIGMTQQLLDHMDKVQALPYNVIGKQSGAADDFNAQLASFTADYLVDETGKVQFIEAGPPFGLGAHPCAFVDNRVQGEEGKEDKRAVISVQGVCLGQGKPPLPLAEFSVSAKKAPRAP